MVDSVYINLDPNSNFFSDDKNDKIDVGNTSNEPHYINNFLEIFENKHTLFWIFEIIGNAFLLLSDESKPTVYEKVAVKAFSIY